MIAAESLAAISAFVRDELPLHFVAGDARGYTGSATIPAIYCQCNPGQDGQLIAGNGAPAASA
jgi:hypothetical protein